MNTPFQRLHAGLIDGAAYLMEMIELATATLDVPPAYRDRIRRRMRRALVSDPRIRRLIVKAIGASPPPIYEPLSARPRLQRGAKVGD